MTAMLERNQGSISSELTPLQGPLTETQCRDVVKAILMEVDRNHAAQAQIFNELHKVSAGGDYRAAYVLNGKEPLSTFIPSNMQENITNAVRAQQMRPSDAGGTTRGETVWPGGGGGGGFRSSS